MRLWRRYRWPGHPRFRLDVDGATIGYFESAREAREAVPDDYVTAWYVRELVGSERCHRWFLGSFGYKTGTTSTAALAAAGVPIAPQCISEKRL